MKFTTKNSLSSLVLALVSFNALAQNDLKSENGYQISKNSGAVYSLSKWDAFKPNYSKSPIVDPQQKVLAQTGSKPKAKNTTYSTNYEFYGGEAYKGNNVPYAAITDAFGNTYITGGSSNENQPSGDFFTQKIGADGTVIWQKREQALMYAVEYGMNIAFDNSGNIVVSGLKWNGNDMDIRVMKYSPEGNKLWETTFDNGNEGIEVPNAMVIGVDGSVYITGITWSGNSVDYLTLKYNSNGQEQWHITENPANSETWNEATAIAVDADQNVIVTGYSPNPDGWLNYHTIKYNLDGTKLWEQAYNYESTDPDNIADVTNSVPRAITTDADGNIFVTGTFDTFLNRIGTLKYDSSGAQQWVQTYKSGTEITLGWKISVTNNTLYVAGSHLGGFSDDGTVLLSYNTDGTQNWVQETTDLIETANATLGFDTTGNIIVSANGMTPGAEEWEQDVAARAYKYSPDGNLLGQAAFVISTTDGTASMTGSAGTGIDSNGNVYFSVNSFYSENGSVFETVKSGFDTTSPEIQWSSMYSNLGSPAASMLNAFADSNGNTFSTGSYYNFTEGMLVPNYFIVKHDAEGNILWNVAYNAANGNAADGIIGRTDADGNAYVCLLPGFEEYPPVLKVIKLSPEGTQLWSSEIELYSPAVHVLEPQADGSVFLGGTAYETEDSQNASFLGIKINAQGTQEWKTFMPGISGNNIFTINSGKVDTNDRLILTGAHGSGNFMSQNVNLTVVQFNADGTPGWITPVVIQGQSSSGTDLFISADNSIYVNGYSQNTETYNEDILTAKINATGEILWSQTFGEEDKKERSYTLKPFSNGDIAVIGYSLANSGDIHNALIKYNSNGEKLWDFQSENMRYYNDFHIDGSDVCYIMDQMIVDPFPHKIFSSPFPTATLITVDANGQNDNEEFFVGPQYAEFFGERLIPHSDNRLLLAGSVGNQAFYEGTYFFETEHDGTLSLPDGLTPNKALNLLGQNYPNPVKEKTTIPFTLVNGGKAAIKLYNLQGRFVKEIANETYAPGANTIEFEPNGIAPGIYFYQIESQGFKQAKKMVIK
ncbi:T9SS type A sorting domain-containing protein [Flavobacterium sp. AG291]|uniref:T9SS type A sorting domain-containing protein n=1 Tax=Flavobacterium sp. AG291 TaxID=2184000 RepID=UPI000E0C0750|nr:T9SS type A sorting domain-containing protein [Flavobacterium sp. AG291]RDI04500.1 putative delta-60 repeat protein/predicted secreted protein (Por secretion system target) [Flavobacterium sp. AG291]